MSAHENVEKPSSEAKQKKEASDIDSVHEVAADGFQTGERKLVRQVGDSRGFVSQYFLSVVSFLNLKVEEPPYCNDKVLHS